MGEVLYEERVYPAGYWACVTKGEDLYEQSISMAFMQLMRFICKENSAGQALPLVLAPPTLFTSFTPSHSPCTPIIVPSTLFAPVVAHPTLHMLSTAVLICPF